MTEVKDLSGECAHPFLQESFFPETGGFIGGRFCQVAGNVSCCVPCPLASWTYGESIQWKTRIASWVSVGVLPFCIFLLISYAVLPAKRTHRHYLSICFTLGICFMQIAFIIPLGIKPEQCYNQITPNDMYSSLSCAFTGALLLFGGWVVVVWSFIRTIAFHLQVCWEVIIGPKFMWGAFICGWGIPIIGMVVMLILTGVSFRFGDVCHINIEKSLEDYWGPIMAFAAAALVIQFTTMGYCMHVYIKSLLDTSGSTTNSSGMPSYTSSVRTLTARQAYRRVRKILKLQWRSISLVLVIIANVIIFAIIFIKMNDQLRLTPENLEKAIPWLGCLAVTQDRTQCFDKVKDIGPNEVTLLVVLILLALVGLWTFILFARREMIVGWIDMFRGKPSSNHEFVSADARNLLTDSRTYEMLNSNNGIPPYKSPEPFIRSPSPAHTNRTMSPEVIHYGKDAKYVRPSMSFSGPRPPSSSQQMGREWDPQATFAPANYTSYQQ